MDWGKIGFAVNPFSGLGWGDMAGGLRGGYQTVQNPWTSNTNNGPWSAAQPYWKNLFGQAFSQQAPSTATSNYYKLYQNSLNNQYNNPYKADTSYLAKYADPNSQTNAMNPYAKWANQNLMETANMSRLNPFSGSTVAAGRVSNPVASLYQAQQFKNTLNEAQGMNANLALQGYLGSKEAATNLSNLANQAALMNYQNQTLLPQQAYEAALGYSNQDMARYLQLAQLLQSAGGSTSSGYGSQGQSGYVPGWGEILAGAAASAGAAAAKKGA